jgi:hypothetical protein
MTLTSTPRLRQIPGMHARSATQPYQDVCTKWMHEPGMLTQGGPAPLASRLHRIPTRFLLNLHGIQWK